MAGWLAWSLWGRASSLSQRCRQASSVPRVPTRDSGRPRRLRGGRCGFRVEFVPDNAVSCARPRVGRLESDGWQLGVFRDLSSADVVASGVLIRAGLCLVLQEDRSARALCVAAHGLQCGGCRVAVGGMASEPAVLLWTRISKQEPNHEDAPPFMSRQHWSCLRLPGHGLWCRTRCVTTRRGVARS